MMPSPLKLSVTIQSDTGLLVVVKDLTIRAAEFAGYPPSDAKNIGLAVDEAVTNVIKHSYHDSPNGTIELSFVTTPERLEVRIVYGGDQLDERAVRAFDLQRAVAERRKGGMGLELMRRVMDTVEFTTDGTKNVCTMTRQLPVEIG